MKKYIYLVTLDWAFDDQHGLEIYPFREYDAAYLLWSMTTERSMTISERSSCV